MSELNYVMGVIQVILQFIGAYVSYVIYTYNRLSKFWLGVTAALVLMSIRRILNMTIELGYLNNYAEGLNYLDRPVFPFIISIFLVWGLWSMKNNFERFDILERKVGKKLGDIKKPEKTGGVT